MKPDFTLPPAPGRPLGEANIWITSIGISVGLIMIFGLLGIILVNGMEAFWPKTIHELTLSPAAEGEKPYTLYASITKDQTRHVPADPTQPAPRRGISGNTSSSPAARKPTGNPTVMWTCTTSPPPPRPRGFSAWNAWKGGRPW